MIKRQSTCWSKKIQESKDSQKSRWTFKKCGVRAHLHNTCVPSCFVHAKSSCWRCLENVELQIHVPCTQNLRSPIPYLAWPLTFQFFFKTITCMPSDVHVHLCTSSLHICLFTQLKVSAWGSWLYHFIELFPLSISYWIQAGLLIAAHKSTNIIFKIFPSRNSEEIQFFCLRLSLPALVPGFYTMVETLPAWDKASSTWPPPQDLASPHTPKMTVMEGFSTYFCSSFIQKVHKCGCSSPKGSFTPMCLPRKLTVFCQSDANPLQISLMVTMTHGHSQC